MITLAQHQTPGIDRHWIIESARPVLTGFFILEVEMGTPVHSSPASSGFVITPNDSATFISTRALIIGTAGALAVTFVDGTDCIIPNAPAGLLPIQVMKVKATGTTASGIVGLV